MENIQSTIDKAKKGDQSSFFALYSDTYPRNRYIALKYMKQEHDADDVLQDAYIKIFKNLDMFTYTGEGSFQSWTSKVVSNTALNYLRKKNPLLFSETEDEDGNDVASFLEDESIDNQPELSYDRKETSMIVSELLNELSEEQRIVVMMYYFQELPVKEIASNCACNENTVKSRLNYARKNLEKKASELRKKGILTSAFTMAGLAFLLRNDFASAAVGEGINRLFGVIWGVFSGSAATSAAGIGTATAVHAAKFLTGKTIAIICCSAVLGGGAVLGVLFAGGFFSNDGGGNDIVPPVTSQEPYITATPTDTHEASPAPVPESTSTPSPTVTPDETPTPEPTPERTKKPKKTESPETTPKPTKKPTPRPTPEPDDDPVEWDDDADWDDGDTDWE